VPVNKESHGSSLRAIEEEVMQLSALFQKTRKKQEFKVPDRIFRSSF
jgi:hypothetical protein